MERRGGGLLLLLPRASVVVVVVVVVVVGSMITSMIPFHDIFHNIGCYTVLFVDATAAW